MGILSDAGWLEEDVPGLHDLTLRLLFLEFLPALMILSVRFIEQWLSNMQGDIVRLHRERREENTKDKILVEGVFKRKSKRV